MHVSYACRVCFVHHEMSLMPFLLMMTYNHLHRAEREFTMQIRYFRRLARLPKFHTQPQHSIERYDKKRNMQSSMHWKTRQTSKTLTSAEEEKSEGRKKFSSDVFGVAQMLIR